jgi:predicted transport protein
MPSCAIYLTVKTGEIPNISEVYEQFKAHARPRIAASGVEELVQEIRSFGRYFCALALSTESDPHLKLAFQDLRDLKVDVSFPFLLELYHDYVEGQLAHADFLTAVRLVEAYVFRRSICAIPTNSMNKTFATFAKALKKDHYLESIQAHLLLLPSYRRMPSDEEFRRELQTRDLYNLRSRSYWLRRLENYGRKERVPVDEYTIEHILPQCDNDLAKVPPAWRADLGPEWERIWSDFRHTLGNLTLTGYNSEYSNNSFRDKRDMKGGFKESPLKLNSGLGAIDQWNEHTIRARASRLADIALNVWAAPKIADEVLSQYRPVADAVPVYTINDHPHLLSPSLYGVFEAFRREVHALDSCVTEEFLKLYVAYKAETNFVDIVPQAKRLRLMLNMPFPEINDPRGICKDVTGLGRWGNGDIEVGLASMEDLPYIMGLVRQSLERQMGNGNDL